MASDRKVYRCNRAVGIELFSQSEEERLQSCSWRWYLRTARVYHSAAGSFHEEIDLEAISN
jgi:hypothetical protein